MSFIDGKVALVTGGASGIGSATAKELLKNGARGLTIADVNVEGGEKVIQDLAKEFGANRILFVKTDVAQEDEIEAAFKKTIATFKNLDIVINAAGILNDKTWEKEIAINLKGTIYSCLLGLDKYLPAHKSGDEAVIVNVSSIGGLCSGESQPIYCATKHGVTGLSKSLGTENHYKRTKVRVLTICPGVTETPLVSEIAGRFLGPQYEELLTEVLEKLVGQRPEEVAKGIAKVIEEGRNGSIWIVNAGKTFQVQLPDIFELLQN